MASFGKLALQQLPWTANMTDQNHLTKLKLARPHQFETTMNQIFSAQNYYSDNALTSMLLGSSAEIEIGQTEWEWELRGATTTPLVILENVLPATETTPGRGRQPFEIKVDKNWYKPGDMISFGTSNKKYQMRIQSEPRAHGNGFIYTVRLASDDFEFFLPVSFLTPGQKVTKLYSQYEEANEERGSTQFAGNLSFRNRLGKYGKQYRITDLASTEVLAVPVMDSRGKKHSMWFNYAEVEWMQQWYREIERAAWYSRSFDSVPGANGRPVLSGAGIQEQLEDSHIEYYNVLTADMIEEYLMDIFYSRVKPGKGRNIVAYTGEYGMLQFHRAIQDKVNNSGFIQNFEQFSAKTSSDVHVNSLAYGYQYTEYRMANGATLTLMHNPLYDDREINHEIDPATGFPKESQRITFLDFGGQGKDSNIKMVSKKDSYGFTYVEGLHGPYGPKQGGSSAHGGSYYEMHIEKMCGVNIEDVTRCGELIKGSAV